MLGLIALAVVAGIVFAIFGGLGQGYYMMRPGFRMMQPYRYGFGYVSPVRGIFGGLLGLGVLVLIIIGIVALVNLIMRSNRSAQVTQTNQPAQQAPAAEMTAPTRTCSNCGKPAQEDWKTCPYCGNPLT